MCGCRYSKEVLGTHAGKVRPSTAKSPLVDAETGRQLRMNTKYVMSAQEVKDAERMLMKPVSSDPTARGLEALKLEHEKSLQVTLTTIAHSKTHAQPSFTHAHNSTTR